MARMGCMISPITNKNNKTKHLSYLTLFPNRKKSTRTVANERYENRKSNGKTAKKRYELVTVILEVSNFDFRYVRLCNLDISRETIS